MPKECNPNQIRNPRTRRCVLKTGRIGRKILAGKGNEYVFPKKTKHSDKTKKLQEELKQVRSAHERALENLRICIQNLNDLEHKHEEMYHRTQHSKQKDHYLKIKNSATPSGKDKYRNKYNKEVKKDDDINKKYLESLKKHEMLVQEKQKC